MKTARDVIENLGFDGSDSLAIIEALVAAPDSIRQELVGLLNPWRPIETAPKDGTQVLGYWRKSDCFGVVEWTNDGNWWGWQTDACEVSSPTHWLPLYAPPKEEKE